MTWLLVTATLMLGLTTLCWACVGLARLLVRPGRGRHLAHEEVGRLTARDVAVLVAAHDEEAVIAGTIEAAARLVGPDQVFVVSDASSDATVDVVRSHGANVLDLWPNRGKAGALVAGLEHFGLADRFAVVMLLDADSRPAADYLETGLPLFEPGVVAVAGRATTLQDTPPPTRAGRVLVAHRERTYLAVQTLHKFGQAAARANVVTIVPGFASMYRTSILDQVDIAAPGLAIEDYNMTFEIHTKELGRIAFDPRAAKAYTQDPDTLGDYVRQMSRWGLGFWQTVLRHRPLLRPGIFLASLAMFCLEVVLSSLLLTVVLPAAALGAVAALLSGTAVDVGGAATAVDLFVPSTVLAAGIVLPDLLLTAYAAVLARRWSYLFLAPAFVLLRIVDAWVNLRALVRALRGGSSGVWRSPARRAVVSPSS